MKTNCLKLKLFAHKYLKHTTTPKYTSTWSPRVPQSHKYIKYTCIAQLNQQNIRKGNFAKTRAQYNVCGHVLLHTTDHEQK